MTNFQKIIIDIVNKDPQKQAGVAEKLGVTDAYVSNFVTGVRPISSKIAKKMEEIYGLDASQLLAIKKREEADLLNNKISSRIAPEGRVIDLEDVKSVRVIVIPIKGQAGLQSHYYDDVLLKELDTEELLTTDTHKGKYFKIEVRGDSMDNGTPKGLQEGDWAYCRSVEKQYWREKLYTHKWKIWCFFHNERGIIFKSIVSHNPETGEMELESLNPNKEIYPNFKINIGECSYVCNVVKKLSNLN